MSYLESTLIELKKSDLLRVNVVGLSGSGKSTVARRLGKAMQVKYVEMDRLFRGPNWTEPTKEEFRNRVAKAISGDSWILDGNYHSKTFDLKWERATSIVWVNTPFVRNIRQSISRAIKRAWSQEELWPGTGNRETFRKSFFSRQSIVLWAFNNYKKVQERYSSIRENPSWHHIRFIELRSRKDIEDFLSRTIDLAQHEEK